MYLRVWIVGYFKLESPLLQQRLQQQRQAQENLTSGPTQVNQKWLSLAFFVVLIKLCYSATHSTHLDPTYVSRLDSNTFRKINWAALSLMSSSVITQNLHTNTITHLLHSIWIDISPTFLGLVVFCNHLYLYYIKEKSAHACTHFDLLTNVASFIYCPSLAGHEISSRSTEQGHRILLF